MPPGIQIHNLCIANAKRSANWAMGITIMCIIFHLLEDFVLNIFCKVALYSAQCKKVLINTNVLNFSCLVTETAACHELNNSAPFTRHGRNERNVPESAPGWVRFQSGVEELS